MYVPVRHYSLSEKCRGCVFKEPHGRCIVHKKMQAYHRLLNVDACWYLLRQRGIPSDLWMYYNWALIGNHSTLED